MPTLKMALRSGFGLVYVFSKYRGGGGKIFAKRYV